MKLRGYLPGFDAYGDGFRHTIIVLTSELGDGWDIAEYIIENGFADATVLTGRAANVLLKAYGDILSRVTTVSERSRTFVDTILDNVIFEWNGKYLIPITYLQAKSKNYIFGYVIQVYRVR